MRDLIYFVGCSVDGFIAAKDGSIDMFPTTPEYLTELFTAWPETCPAHAREALGVHSENKHFDAVLMGRNTYAVGLPLGVTSPYPTLDQYVVSTTMGESPDEAVTLISDDVAGFVSELKCQPGKDIWLCGGASLAGVLHNEGLIDELILKVYPLVLGSGIPLFSETTRTVDLELAETTTFPADVIINRYRVQQ